MGPESERAGLAVLAVILAALVAAAGLGLRAVRRRTLIAWLVASLALATAAAVAAIDTYPWNNLLVLSIALNPNNRWGDGKPLISSELR